MANIKVAVRVRPISARELNLTGSEVVVRTDSNEISLTNLKVSSSKAGDSRERTRKYGFDYCFDSSNPETQSFADQATIYQTLGQTVLDAVFTGYNSCLVAYGQSASGKTYTMMGTKEDPGLTPRLCQGIFARIEDERRNERSYSVSVSYLEIYNERVRDLLKPSSSTSGLRVREHPRLGPYVQGLTHHAVCSLGSLMSYVEEGTKARKTASTLQNRSSSRSHALLTIAVAEESHGVTATPARRNEISPRGGSKLRLVDLAGSESAATCSGVHRLKEGANINKSLVALGNVISALAERGTAGSGPGRRFIPYRDSSLTWLLKDALGGNATTIMLATISPASGSYNETAHTLRFAQRVQSVVNRPVVNEDPVARIIRELRAEVARLRCLLLEKNVEPVAEALCCCQTRADRSLKESAERGRSSVVNLEVKSQEDETAAIESRTEVEEKGSKSVVSVRRSSSSDSCCVAATHATKPDPRRRKRFGSLEYLATSERFNRAKVTELNDEEDEEVSEIHESVFVDIPTLVAVLIKPDNNLHGSSVQIEEICSDEVAEESIDAEFEPANDHEEEAAFDESEKLDSVDHDDRSSSVNSCHAFGENEASSSLDVCQSTEYARLRSPRQRREFRKQDTVDVLPSSVLSNLHALKKFGSVEAIEKKRDPVFSLERSHTNLENRSNSIGDRAKKLKNIREIDDHQKNVSSRSGWPKERKDSNDSDKSLKEPGAKSRSYARKPSLDSLKRKTSKDSSSSSSKDEQILISSLARDKLLRRKSSLEQEPSTRSHTPIQRTKRAEIVAAVTERLYSSRKHLDDVGPGVRSPPDTGCDAAKSAAKLKLQEISRKMLGKRKRVCVDTQTECSRTVRMRDTASLTETPQITRQDVGVLTDRHEACEYASGVRTTPILRVKETATWTEKPRTRVVKCRDVASLANDLEEYDYGIHSSPRNDSGILSSSARNHAESNSSSAEVSDLQGQDRRVAYAETSTNTSTFSSCRNLAVQTSPLNEATASCARQCCSPRAKDPENRDRSVISISLPDTVSIIIETTSAVGDSRIVAATAQMDHNEPSLQPNDAKRGGAREAGAQTDDEWNDPRNEIYCSRDQAASAPSQTDGRVFRIENIFHDPNNAAKNSRVDSNRTEDGTRIRNSITFRNSLGTSYVSQPKRYELAHEGLHAGGFIRNGLITEAFINRKRSFNSRRAPSTAVYQDPWRNWQVPTSSTMANNFSKGLGAVVPAAWRPEVEGTPFELRGSCVEAGESPADHFQLDSIDEISGTRSPYSGSLNGNAADHEHGFSDDSLDYNEINVSDETLKAKATTEQREKNLCPPDVVAHTKKDCPKAVDSSEKNEPVSDPEDGRIAEFPKRKPIETTTDASNARDYESLILGRACYSYEEANDESNIRADGSGKKKVSFCERKSSPESPATLKPIIKNRKKKNATETASPIRSFNEDGSDGSRQEESLEDGNEDEDFAANSKHCRRKVKFSVEESSENTSCSESDSYENVEDEEVEEGEDEEVLLNREGENVLEEYLSEAVTFMRNLNSVSEYANRSMLKRNPLSWTSLVRGRDGKRGARRRDCPSSSWDRDYSEFVSPVRKVSSKKVDDDDYPGEEQQEQEEQEEEEEDIAITTDSYERCLKGIQRLEDCIRRVDRHNELLRAKYGVDCESAGARLDLASPSTEARASPTADDSEILRETEVPLFRGAGVVDRKEGDDLEKKIFDQLMNVANSIRYGNSSRLRSRGSLLATAEPRSRSPGTKFRDKYRRATNQPPFCGDVRGNLSVEEASNDRRDLTTYEITGNLSVERTCSTERKNDDLDHALEEGFSPLRRLNRTSWPADSNCPASMEMDEHSSSFSRQTDCFRKAYNTANARTKRFQETDDYSRRAGEAGRRHVCACWKDHAVMESTAGEIAHLRDKLKYPGSPRARFLELLRERRRIVECSRGTSAS